MKTSFKFIEGKSLHGEAYLEKKSVGYSQFISVPNIFSTVQFISTFSYQSRHNIQLKQINLTIPFGRP
jgi:hypothetical protein